MIRLSTKKAKVSLAIRTYFRDMVKFATNKARVDFAIGTSIHPMACLVANEAWVNISRVDWTLGGALRGVRSQVGRTLWVVKRS